MTYNYPRLEPRTLSMHGAEPMLYGIPNELESSENLNSFKSMIKSEMAQTVNATHVSMCLKL